LLNYSCNTGRLQEEYNLQQLYLEFRRCRELK